MRAFPLNVPYNILMIASSTTVMSLVAGITVKVKARIEAI
jgi:hypothetical protein